MLDLIKNKVDIKVDKKNKYEEVPFLVKVRKNTLRQRKSLAFFVGFAAFCFAGMIQMSANMDKLADELFAYILFGIGVVLSVVIMLLAMSTLMREQRKNIGMMRVFGYHMKECRRNILNCYRPIVCACFVLGTVYQYALLRIMVDVVFKDMEVPELEFNFPALIGTAIAFAIFYEALLYYYSSKLKKLPIKEIMLEAE